MTMLLTGRRRFTTSATPPRRTPSRSGDVVSPSLHLHEVGASKPYHAVQSRTLDKVEAKKYDLNYIKLVLRPQKENTALKAAIPEPPRTATWPAW